MNHAFRLDVFRRALPAALLAGFLEVLERLRAVFAGLVVGVG